MKNTAAVLFLLVFISVFGWAAGPVVSVSDFQVESDNPDYKYLGKGIAILVAGELRKSNQIQLIEREALNQILKEQEISISDLTDAQSQVKIGRLLSAQYLLMGKVVDMAGTLIVSVRLTDVGTGEIVWQDTLTAKVGAYDYIGAYFAKSLLGHFGATVAATTTQKVEQQVVKPPEAIVALSQGVDALDRNDTSAAQASLQQAQALDPTSDAAAYYLSKLTVNTTKFQITIEPYYSYQNPAYLGIIKTDRMYLGASMPAYIAPTWNPIPFFNSIAVNATDYLSEFNAAGKIGYQFPLGERLGLSIDGMFMAIDNRVLQPMGSGVYGGFSAAIGGFGGIVSIGYRLLDWLSLGIGISVYGQNHTNSFPVTMPESVACAGNAGVLFLNSDETFLIDSRFGYSTGTVHLIDPNTLTIEPNEVGIPLYNENTVTFALSSKATFLIFKQTNEIALDRSYYFGRLLFGGEQFFTEWFSFRGGLEGSFMLLDNVQSLGYGGVVATTIRIIPWGLDIDVNLSYRFRPSYVIAGLMYADFGMLTTISLNNKFISRK
jgi:TolB-like protein